jgi:hypothetical protein
MIGSRVMRTLAFLVLRRILGLVNAGQAPDASDVEIAALRHRLALLRLGISGDPEEQHDDRGGQRRDAPQVGQAPKLAVPARIDTPRVDSFPAGPITLGGNSADHVPKGRSRHGGTAPLTARGVPATRSVT